MYCELNTFDTPVKPWNNLYVNSIYGPVGVSALAAVKNYFTSDGVLFIKMLTKVCKITKIISSLSLLIDLIAIRIGGIV